MNKRLVMGFVFLCLLLLTIILTLGAGTNCGGDGGTGCDGSDHFSDCSTYGCFKIKNSSGDTVAVFDSEGNFDTLNFNIISEQSLGTSMGFVIWNSTEDKVAHITSAGRTRLLGNLSENNGKQLKDYSPSVDSYENVKIWAFTRESCNDPTPPANVIWPSNGCGALTNISTNEALDANDNNYVQLTLDAAGGDSEEFYGYEVRFDESADLINYVNMTWRFKGQWADYPDFYVYYWNYTSSSWNLCYGPVAGTGEVNGICNNIPASDVVNSSGNNEFYAMLYAQNTFGFGAIAYLEGLTLTIEYDNYTPCAPTASSFIILNSTDVCVAFFNNTGDLWLKGKAGYNARNID